MITVHHLNNSRSQRVLWLLEELGVRYEVRRYERDKKTMLAPPELKAIHPLGKSPVITDEGRTLAETGAIIEYILARYGNGRLVPEAGSEDQLRFLYWLHYAEGSAMTPLLLKLVFTKIASTKMPFFAKPIARGIADKVLSSFVDPNLARQMAFMESELSPGPWFLGANFSAADVQMSFPIEAANQRAGLAKNKTPRLLDWLARAHARPAYQRALARGGKYDFA